ncbi:lytic transglycosylase domain-containing protein [Asaia spathodeae]|uniref:Lytic transglycosylase domain-containing protein n=1 Tax=Asaia spathodeae TaxID=657016 RepID=A0ABX2P9N0_9PROT|nr:lytic transglycosylase domain-containing protein [Asaia spathodeae]
MIGPLLAACAAFVAPSTLDAVISVESGGNELAIHDNSGANPPSPRNLSDAIRTVEHLISVGHSVDIGLMQINSRNLPALGLSVSQVFRPCENIHAGASILASGFARALRAGRQGQDALQVALSYYNTGSPLAGFENGYVARYYIKVSPHEIRRWAGPSGQFKKTTSPYQIETEIEIPDDYFHQVSSGR